MMFPGANARIYRNEAGEVMGWDYPSEDDEVYDPDDYLHDPYEDDDDYDEDVERRINDRKVEDKPDDSWLEMEYENRTELGDAGDDW
ncbi:hypothetical protein [Neptunomonas sp.]|uniref:hypothetical protein n=1 Tax=Neptunomonas sp. TaxID=1971898 RepID=UPI00356940F5